MVRKKIKI